MYTQEEINQMSIEELYDLKDSLTIQAMYLQHQTKEQRDAEFELVKAVNKRIRAIEAV